MPEKGWGGLTPPEIKGKFCFFFKVIGMLIPPNDEANIEFLNHKIQHVMCLCTFSKL